MIFVLDHDLTRTEYEPLSALVREGKRSIVFFNKVDRFSEADRAAILARLKERLRGLVLPDDIVSGAASPRPINVRVQLPDGTVETRLEGLPGEIDSLRKRIAGILAKEGESLAAGNLLLRAHMLTKKRRSSSRSSATLGRKASSRSSSGSLRGPSSPIHSPPSS